MPEGSPRLITVVLAQDGTATKLVEMLRAEMNLASSSIYTARGTAAGAPGHGKFGLEVEKDIFSVIVPAEQAEEAFARIYEFTEMGHRHGGFMFQAKLGRADLLTLPEGEAEARSSVRMARAESSDQDE